MNNQTDTSIRVGVDIVGIARFADLISEHPDAIMTLFTEREIAYCQPKRRCHEHMAARFAAKEAVLKAFGTGIGQRMRWTDVEVINEVTGRPRILLSGAVATWAQIHGLLEIDVSLSHTSTLAIAQVVAVWERQRKGETACVST
jgi:holo-[acyl-carrier protein] synthase